MRRPVALGRAFAAAVTLLGACTAFEGLEPDIQDVAPGGGGGNGGGPEELASLLPTLEAASLCSVLFRCPTLGGSIFLSTGIPLVQTGADGRPSVWNYSACIDWLTAPLAEGRVGFEALRDDIFNNVISSTLCDEVEDLLPFALSGAPSEVCQGAPEDLCSGGDAVACPTGVIAHCAGEVFAPGSTCLETSAVACAVGTCAAPEVRCDAEFVFECTPSGLIIGYSCENYGLSCQAPSGCVASNGPTTCSEIGEQRCADGDRRARACAVRQPSGELLAAEVECDAMGMVCVEQGKTARCTAPTATCSPYDVGQNLCQGNEVSLCVGGAATTFDCSRLGLTCVPGSPDGSQTAHCG